MHRHEDKTVMMFSSVVWRFYKARPQELAYALQKQYGYNMVYMEPLKYPGGTSTRLQEYSQNPEDGVDVRHRKTRFRKGLFLLAWENLRNLAAVMKQRPHVVISNDHLMTVLVALYCKLHGIPFIFDQLDYWIEVEQKPVIRAYVKRIIYPVYGWCGTAITSTSHFLQKYAKQYTKKSLYAPNGKSSEDIKLFDLHSEKSATVSKKIVFIGTLRDWYDFDTLIRACTQFPELELHFYGDGPLKEYLQHTAEHDKTIFVHDSVNSSDVPALVSSSLCGVLPLKNNELNKGTFPIKLLEYWAAQKAVIVTPTDELQKVGEGVCVFAETVDEWKAAIQQLLDDSSARDALGKKGRERLEQLYTYEKIAEQFHSLLCP